MADSRTLVFTVLGIDKTSDVLDNVGNKLESLGRKSQVMLAGTVGASVAASAAISGALLGMPLLFGGMALAAVAKTTEVAGTFDALGESIRTGVMEDAAPLQNTFVGAARAIGAAYTELRPQMAAAFQASAPMVRSLTESVIGFARNAMPGMVEAVRESGPVFRGLDSLLQDTGSAVGDFFGIIAEGSPQAGEGLAHLGNIVETILPAVGRALVALTSIWAEHGDQVSRVVEQLTATIGDLGGGALPVMSQALGVGLDILEGLLSVIGPIADEIGPLIGMILGLTAALKLMESGRNAIVNVTSTIGDFRKEMGQAGGPAGAGRLATAAGGLMNMLGGPWGIALAAAGIGLMMFGQRAQDTAADTRSLTSALRESNGQFDDNARRTLMNSKGYKDISDSVTGAGLTHKMFIGALEQGGYAMDNVVSRLEKIRSAGETVETQGGEMVVMRTAESQSAHNLLTAYEGLAASIGEAKENYEAEQEAISGADNAMRASIPGAEAFREAMATLADETADTASRVDALNTAWRHLFGLTLDLDDAVAEFEGGLDALREQITGLKEDTGAWRAELFDATGAVNLTTEAGRELHENLTSQGESYRAVAQSAYDASIRRREGETAATAAATAAVEERRAAFGRELASLGFTQQQVTNLTNKYLGMPKDIITRIKAETAEAERRVNDFVRNASGKVIGIRVVVSQGGATQAVVNGKPVGLPRLAEGGTAYANRAHIVGEDGAELFVPNTNGTVIPTRMTARILDELRGARVGIGGRMARMRPAPGGVVSGGGVVTVRLAADGAETEMLRLLRRMVRIEGSGDVQLAFGR